MSKTKASLEALSDLKQFTQALSMSIDFLDTIPLDASLLKDEHFFEEMEEMIDIVDKWRSMVIYEKDELDRIEEQYLFDQEWERIMSIKGGVCGDE